jgi:hypothetical protein
MLEARQYLSPLDHTKAVCKGGITGVVLDEEPMACAIGPSARRNVFYSVCLSAAVLSDPASPADPAIVAASVEAGAVVDGVASGALCSASAEATRRLESSGESLVCDFCDDLARWDESVDLPEGTLEDTLEGGGVSACACAVRLDAELLTSALAAGSLVPMLLAAAPALLATASVAFWSGVEG